MDSRIIPRVLMLGPSLSSRGGMATVEAQIMERLVGFGVDAEFISTYEDCGKPKKAAIALIAYVKFCRTVKDVDIVHIHMASRGSYERKAFFLKKALREGKKTVVHLHGGQFDVWYDDEIDDKKRDEIKVLLSKADVLIALSEEWESWLLSRGFAPQKIIVMHNAVPVPKRACEPSFWENVLFLGRLDTRKSPDVLLRASKRMLEDHPEAKLIFGGDGYPERYKALACNLGIADRCEFLGWITGEDKEKLFKRAGVYCLPSKNEGMPMSVLEAMAHGVPTIATPVGGVPQVIEDGANGYLMPVDDEERLAELLCMLMDNPNLRAEIGAAGRESVAYNFDIELIVERLCQIYWELFS